MKLNRKRVTFGLVGLGVAGALAGGAGVAAAAGPSSSAPSASGTSTAAPCGDEAGGGDGMRGMAAFDEHRPMSAAASYLGLSQDELRTELQSGKSLAEIAKAQGKSVSALKNAMIAAVKTNLDANTRLTDEQKTTILAELTSRIDTMVNTIHQAGAGLGPMGTRMGRMGR
jgi:hypothetical protein